MYNKKEWICFLLRLGIAFSFLYAGIGAISNPLAWVGFIPSFIEIFFSRELFLYIHGGFDILLGLWFLSNKKVFYASTISSIFLFGIIIFNMGAFDIVFRDLSILLAAIALSVMTKE